MKILVQKKVGDLCWHSAPRRKRTKGNKKHDKEENQQQQQQQQQLSFVWTVKLARQRGRVSKRARKESLS